MKKLFFLSVSDDNASKLSEKDVIKAAAEMVRATGVDDFDLVYAEAVHCGNPSKIEQGVAVYIKDDELAFRSALALKSDLRQGTYLVILNGASFPNVSFLSVVDNKDASVSELVLAWQKSAALIFDSKRIFVSAFVFKDSEGYVNVIGNANPDMVFNINQWEASVFDIVFNLNENSEHKLSLPIVSERQFGFEGDVSEFLEKMMFLKFRLMNCGKTSDMKQVVNKAIEDIDAKMFILQKKYQNEKEMAEVLAEWQIERASFSEFLEE